MYCDDFANQFNEQYPAHDWHSVVQLQVNEAIGDCLRMVTSQPPPIGLEHNDQCRAMYGVDVMLNNTANGKCVLTQYPNRLQTPAAFKSARRYSSSTSFPIANVPASTTATLSTRCLRRCSCHPTSGVNHAPDRSMNSCESQFVIVLLNLL